MYLHIVVFQFVWDIWDGAFTFFWRAVIPMILFWSFQFFLSPSFCTPALIALDSLVKPEARRTRHDFAALIALSVLQVHLVETTLVQLELCLTGQALEVVLPQTGQCFPVQRCHLEYLCKYQTQISWLKKIIMKRTEG